MKKFISFIIALVLITLPIASVSATEVTVQKQTTYLSDGSYYVTTIEQDITSPFARTSSKSGSKTAKYYDANNKEIFYIKVSGTFSYTGSSATAQSASATIGYYISGCTTSNRSSYTSGNKAVASATVKYQGKSLSKSVTLSCSANGTLS